MLAYFLDTNAVIALLARKSKALIERVLSCKEGEIGLSAIVAYELYFGAFRSSKVAFNLETLRLFTADFPLVAFDRDDALVSGQVRAALAARGTPIGPYDVLIAGQAKAKGVALVTSNVGEFQRVEGLKVEDWTNAG
jgi:tRNA(fMet)-specific endonuclease VapC